jgi:hypothetical protein
MKNTLTLGAGQMNRVLENADILLRNYPKKEFGDTGYQYIKYQPITPKNELFPEDLAVILLVNSNATYKAFQSIQAYRNTIDIGSLPQKSLEEADESEIESLAQFIAKVANWTGFGSSLATKVLHKKRPELIPILDNQAIYGAYMNRFWPEKRSLQDTVKDRRIIEKALKWIRYDLNRPENRVVWPRLQEVEPTFTLIELFDCVWWTYFRTLEPVNRKSSQR